MTMTITLHWWIVPILVFVCAALLSLLIDDKSGWDFSSALVLLIGTGLAVGMFIGHFV
jgi:hypothetical protein